LKLGFDFRNDELEKLLMGEWYPMYDRNRRRRSASHTNISKISERKLWIAYPPVERWIITELSTEFPVVPDIWHDKIWNLICIIILHIPPLLIFWFITVLRRNSSTHDH
jgi:hypothetical protein